MFGLGWMEISLILVIALMVFGPKKLPELARKLGEGIREFKNASESFKATVNDEVQRPVESASSGPVYNDHDGPVPNPGQLPDGQEKTSANPNEVVDAVVEEGEKAAEPAKS